MLLRILLFCLFLLSSIQLTNSFGQTQGSLRPVAPRQQTRSVAQTPAVSNQDTMILQIQKDVASLKAQFEKTEREKQKTITGAVLDIKMSYVVFGILILWIAILLLYYFWAIRYHVVNYGLSKRMWKILYPEALAVTDWGKKRLEKARQKLIDRRMEEQAGRAVDMDED